MKRPDLDKERPLAILLARPLPLNPHPYLSHCFYGRTKLTQKSMLVSTYWPYYSEMEYKENYGRVMRACVKNIIHLGQRPPKCWGPRLQPTKPIGESGTDSEAVLWLVHQLLQSALTWVYCEYEGHGGITLNFRNRFLCSSTHTETMDAYNLTVCLVWCEITYGDSVILDWLIDWFFGV